MIRLAVRQLRLPAASTGVLLAGLAVFLLLTERAMTAYMHHSGLSACFAAHGDCTLQSSLFSDRYGWLLTLIGWLNFVPMLGGLFWGAPLIAREVEQGTHRLVWTQSVSRRRWLSVKLAVFVLAAILAAAVLTALFTWWFHPFAAIDTKGDARFGRMNLNVFDFQGTVFTAYTVYAFALGTAAGAVIRRTVPAMAVTLGGYLGLRLFVQGRRGHFLPPQTITIPLKSTSPRTGLGDWIVSGGVVDRFGHDADVGQLAAACPGSGGGSDINLACVAAHGYRFREVYQPASRFWPLQGIESGIFLAVSVALLALAAWWTLRRIS